MEGGDLQVATWIKDEGFDTTIPSVMQVLHCGPLQDLCMGLFCLPLRQCTLKPGLVYHQTCPGIYTDSRQHGCCHPLVIF